MVDTVRTKSALLALLADNTARAISAQDLRDFLVSVMGLTKSVYVPATSFILGSGATLASVGTGASYDRVPAWALDPTTDQWVNGSFMLPTDWAGGALTLIVHWAPSSSNVGDVRWDIGVSDIAVGDQADEGKSFPTVIHAAGGVAEARRAGTCTSTVTPTQPFIGLSVYRSAAVGTDTFTGNAWFLGLELQYTGL